MNERMGIGIVGLGEHMARGHVAHLKTMPEVRILRWFDPNDEGARECFDGSDVKPERSSFEEILGDKEIGTVFIGSPDRFHAEQLLRSVEAGKSVFCEKPVIVREEEKQMLHLAYAKARADGLIISSCHPRRFDPPFLWLKEKLGNRMWVEEYLGKVTDFVFDFWYHKVTDEWKKDRSLLKDHFGHEIDLYRFLFGDGLAWHARVGQFNSFDSYQVIGLGRNGLSPDFAFTGHRSLEAKIYAETVTVKGTKNALVIQVNNGLGTWMRDGGTFSVPKMDYDARFFAVNDDFIQAVRNGGDPYLSQEDVFVNNVSSVDLCSPAGKIICG